MYLRKFRAMHKKMMSHGDTSPIYPVTKEEQQLVRQELGLKDSTIEEDIDAIIDWFQKQPHLVEAGIDRCFVERMLIAAKGSIERTKIRIDNWYKYRLLAPEIIQDREKVLSESQDLWTSYLQVAIPKLYNGNRISLIRFIDSNASNFSFEAFVRNTFMLGDIRMRTDYFLGDIWVYDMKNFSFAHLLRLNPTICHKVSNLFHQGMGLRVHSIHVLNATNFVHQVINFVRPYLSKKLVDRIIVHESLNELHKILPKKYLPKDYGGEQRSMEEFKDMYEKELRNTKTKQLLIDSMKMVSNEKLRSDSDINEDYLAGSFRKLDFD